MMNRFKLYRMLRRNNKLAFRRSPTFEQSMAAKVLMVLGGGFFVFYLLLYGFIIGTTVQRGEYATVMGFMPFLLTIDFFIRFMVQQTPDMLVKPYLLLPVSKFAVIENFLISSVNSVYNWLWMAFFLPYSVLALSSGCSFSGVLATLLACQLLVMLNSQIYLLIRTLIARSLLWWLLAVVIYALPFLPWIVKWSAKGFDQMFYLYVDAGSSVLSLPVIVATLAAMLWLNRQLQFRFVYEEIARDSDSGTVKTVSQLNFLEHFGQTGEYLKLEIKSVMRNKTMRSRFWMSLALIAVFSALIAYTPIYDGVMMTHFWCFYCFALYGVTSLTKVMGPEGNYIDLLLTHRENILSLLHAKYIFHCLVLLVPLVVMLPAVIEGKFSVLMMAAYMLLTSGLLYFIMFQLAVYNKQTLLLEQKITGKGNFENGIQLAIEMAAFVVPIAIVAVLQLTFSEETAFIIQVLIGLAFTLSYPFWMRNIYRRMMVRRYENLEGFHASR